MEFTHRDKNIKVKIKILLFIELIFCNRFKEFMFQPLTDRKVVETVCPIGNEDGEQENADCYEDVCAERSILMAVSPSHLHIDERIVGDVDGITYLP